MLTQSKHPTAIFSVFKNCACSFIHLRKGHILIIVLTSNRNAVSAVIQRAPEIAGVC